jgi:hypothetical protein
MTIRCSQGHDNPDGSAFCDECGEPLAAAAMAPASGPASAGPAAGSVTCATCGTVNRMGEAFCTNCGVSLAAAPSGTGAPAAAMPTAAGVATAASPRLTIDEGKPTASSFDLAGKSEVLIGREDPVSNVYPDVDLTPHGGEEGGVSRMHAKLLINNGQYLIEDQNSTNYTFVNKQRLQAKVPTPIKDGDEIRLGRVAMTFHAS